MTRSRDSLTPQQQYALSVLEQHGGEGAIDQFGRLIAAGEVLRNKASEPFSAATWLRLLTFGFLEIAGPYRIRVTR